MNAISMIGRRWNGKRLEPALIGLAIVAFLSLLTWQQLRISLSNHSTGCYFPAIFNFGDSNSDTGAVSAVFDRVGPPNGVTFFGRPAGRLCDGRLVIDFFAEKLRLPYLSAYLDSIGSNFSNGANFAASGSTIKPVASFNPLHLGIQLSQFDQLKARTFELRNTGSSVKSSLPSTEHFSEALYTMDTGQNDLHAVVMTMAEDQVKEKYIPSIVDQFALSLERLYQQGARAFWIHNTGPIGCLPFFVMNYPPKPENTDPIGCLKSYNEVAQEFNKQLKDKVTLLRTRLKDAMLVYVDIYTVKYSLISRAKELGFVDPLGFCLGHVNGSEINGGTCAKPSEYISWDGIHYTESANNWIANHIMDGSLSDPMVPISGACR